MIIGTPLLNAANFQLLELKITSLAGRLERVWPKERFDSDLFRKYSHSFMDRNYKLLRANWFYSTKSIIRFSPENNMLVGIQWTDFRQKIFATSIMVRKFASAVPLRRYDKGRNFTSVKEPRHLCALTLENSSKILNFLPPNQVEFLWLFGFNIVALSNLVA